MTGSTADLHLVVHAEGLGKVVKLFSPEARFLVQKAATLSVPIWALDSEILDQLEVTGTMPKGTASSTTDILRMLWGLCVAGGPRGREDAPPVVS